MKRFMSATLVVLAAIAASGCATLKQVDWDRAGAIALVQGVSAATQVAADVATRDIIFGGHAYRYDRYGWYGIQRRIDAERTARFRYEAGLRQCMLDPGFHGYDPDWGDVREFCSARAAVWAEPDYFRGYLYR